MWDGMAITVGIVIGVGIFRVPSQIAQSVNGPALTLFVWVLGGFLSLCGALTLAELASRHPETGGIYVYLRESFGLFPAFLFSWMETLIIRPGSLAALAVV